MGASSASASSASASASAATAAASVDVFGRDLGWGDRGADVAWLQYLVLRGGKSTGEFDGRTERALKAWQRWEGLPATGYFGPQSRRRAEPALRKVAAARGLEGRAVPGTAGVPPWALSLPLPLLTLGAAFAALLAAVWALPRWLRSMRARQLPPEPQSLRDFVEDAKRRRLAAWGEAGPPRLEPPLPPPEVTALVYVGSQPLGLAVRESTQRAAGVWEQFMDGLRTVLTLRPAGNLKKRRAEAGSGGWDGGPHAYYATVDVEPSDFETEE